MFTLAYILRTYRANAEELRSIGVEFFIRRIELERLLLTLWTRGRQKGGLKRNVSYDVRKGMFIHNIAICIGNFVGCTPYASWYSYSTQ